jgi:hypothetical protein
MVYTDDDRYPRLVAGDQITCEFQDGVNQRGVIVSANGDDSALIQIKQKKWKMHRPKAPGSNDSLVTWVATAEE